MQNQVGVDLILKPIWRFQMRSYTVIDGKNATTIQGVARYSPIDPPTSRLLLHVQNEDSVETWTINDKSKVQEILEIVYKDSQVSAWSVSELQDPHYL